MKGCKLFFCNSKSIHTYAETLSNPKIGCSTAGNIGLSGMTDAMTEIDLSDDLFDVEVRMRYIRLLFYHRLMLVMKQDCLQHLQ